MKRFLVFWVFLCVAWIGLGTMGGCSGGEGGGGGGTGGGGGSAVDAALVGDWRILTETIYYDNPALGRQTVTPVSTRLELDGSGTWTFGSSTGTWSVASITADDWTEWGVDDYGPTRKLVLNNWNGGTGEGPIDETDTTIDNLWTIYRYDSPENGMSTIWLKFGLPE